MMRNSFSIMALVTIFTCSETSKDTKRSEVILGLERKVEILNKTLIEAAIENDVNKAINLYAKDALLLAEYNPLIDGKEGVKKFYNTLFSRENLTTYQKKTTELFDFGETILEIGVFQKSFVDRENQQGTYWNIFTLQEDESILLSAETFGYFKSIANPASMVVDSIEERILNLQPRAAVKIPLEFDAYGALMENIVRDRDTRKMLEMYTDDGSYTPYGDTTKAGIVNLSKHYYAYHKNPVVIDSIESSTYDYIKLPNGVIRYTQFYVEWTVPAFSGKNEGTGIVYLKRQDDNSLKIHRQIAHHIYKKND